MTVQDFNARFKVGEVITVWPGARQGEGIPAEVLAPALVSAAGLPWVPIRYRGGRRPGGTDHVVLTHVAKREASPC